MNAKEVTKENAFRFEFLPPGPQFAWDSLIAAKPVYANGIRINIKLSQRFLDGFGLHNTCYKFTKEYVEAHAKNPRYKIPPYHICMRCNAG